jgi:hypothetical protein
MLRWTHEMIVGEFSLGLQDWIYYKVSVEDHFVRPELLNDSIDVLV